MIRPSVKIAMVDLKIIEKAYEICRENGIGAFIHHRKLHCTHKQPVHELIVDANKRCKALLEMIFRF